MRAGHSGICFGKVGKFPHFFFHWRLPLIGLHANEDYFLCVHIWTNLVRNVLSIFRHFNIQPGYQQGQRHLREDIQKKTAERVKMVSWGEGQKNYWIFIIYKWWKTWKGGSQSNILLLHRTQIWLIWKEKLPIYDYLHRVFDFSCLVSSCFVSDDVKLISEHWNVTTNVLQ